MNTALAPSGPGIAAHTVITANVALRTPDGLSLPTGRSVSDRLLNSADRKNLPGCADLAAHMRLPGLKQPSALIHDPHLDRGDEGAAWIPV